MNLKTNHQINQRLEKLRKSYQFLVVEGDIAPDSEAAILIKDEIEFLENGLKESFIKRLVANQIDENSQLRGLNADFVYIDDFSEQQNDSETYIENIFAFLLFILGFMILFAATVFAIYLILPKNLYI
jgi:nitrogen fixation/metabolism regulation signal transduction histidine kinase